MKDTTIVLIALTAYLYSLLVYVRGKAKEKEINNTTNVIVPQQPPPEYKKGPFRTYAPTNFQQMGVLTSSGQPTLPLYGRRNPYHRDRFNYYTLTAGNQMYPLNLTIDGKDCSEDLGCQELYGNESVSVVGSSNTYTADVYRVV